VDAIIDYLELLKEPKERYRKGIGVLKENRLSILIKENY